MIGKHKCRRAQNTDLKGAIAIGLDEAFTALEESFYDLSDEQMRAFAVPGHNCIAWIVMHSLQNLDEYTKARAFAEGIRAGEQSFKHEDRWDLWQYQEDERPKPTDSFPSSREALDALKAVRDSAMVNIDAATDEDLRRPVNDHFKVVADMYMRTIFHAMAHVRQIWLLRGALGLTDGKSWPQQHWA